MPVNTAAMTRSDDQQYENIRLDRSPQGVTTLTLNRPEKRNAMSPGLHEDVVAALEELRYDEATRVLVITGAPPAFCAGMDLKAFFLELDGKPAEYDRIGRMAVEWRGRTLRQFPKPTIAKVNGFCFGGAFAIVEGCDIAIAAESATFGLSEINFSMFPGGAVSKALANILSPRDALFYALTGRPFDGRRAAEIGLVTMAVADEQLDSVVGEVALELAAKNPEALKATKEAFHYSVRADWDSSVAYTAAREQEVTLRNQNSWRSEDLTDFAAGKFRPGLDNKRS